MKIAAISDLHGNLPIIDECELCLICGDSIPLSKQYSHASSVEWFNKDFRNWAEKIPCNKVLFIAGNHEVGIEYYEEEMKAKFPKEDKLTFLHDMLYIYKDLKIYGTPYCKEFGNWAYTEDDNKLKELFSEIPNDLDILLTHDCPYGYGDVLMQQVPWNDKSHLGNKPLAEAILEKQPKYHFSGHLHSSSHNLTMINKTKHYNVSYLDEYYYTVYKPLYLDI